MIPSNQEVFMRTGRLAIQTASVTTWLQDILTHGPVLVEDIKKRTPASWRTTMRVKADLAIKSKMISGRWHWFLESAPDITQALTAADDPEDATMYTPEMERSIRYMNTHGEDQETITRLVIKDCHMYPSKPPYPDAYVRELVHNILHGKPKPAIPAGIEEPF
jgi:hypothetical protein